LNLDGVFVLVDLELLSAIETYLPTFANALVLRNDAEVDLLGDEDMQFGRPSGHVKDFLLAVDINPNPLAIDPQDRVSAAPPDASLHLIWGRGSKCKWQCQHAESN
jgi:hypothetical protein